MLEQISVVSTKGTFVKKMGDIERARRRSRKNWCQAVGFD